MSNRKPSGLAIIAALLYIIVTPLPITAQASGFFTNSSAIFAQSPGASLTGQELLKLYAAGKFEEVRTKALVRIQDVKNDIDAYVGLSWSLVALRRYSEAETWARRGYSLQADPRLAQAVGEASYYLGKNENALQMLQEYIASYPEGLRAGLSYYLCGELYIRLAKFMHADIAFSAALRYNPSNPVWWTRMGWARESAKRYLQALSAYEQALALNPNFTDAAEGRKRIQARMQG
jgi:tetratricopeptide (TPR) repeat protein